MIRKARLFGMWSVEGAHPIGCGRLPVLKPASKGLPMPPFSSQPEEKEAQGAEKKKAHAAPCLPATAFRIFVGSPSVGRGIDAIVQEVSTQGDVGALEVEVVIAPTIALFVVHRLNQLQGAVFAIDIGERHRG
jgi:hypothetical protein